MVIKVKMPYIKTTYNTVKTTSKKISQELGDTCRYYRNNAQNGWQTGQRLSRLKKFSPLKSFSVKCLNVLCKTKIKHEHIPTLLGGVGAISPLPGGTILGYALGKLITKATKFLVK